MMKANFLLVILLACTVILTSCGDDDDPPIENPEEEITRVTARFTNVADNTDVITAVWFDEDGEGTGAPVIDEVVLDAGTEYLLVLQLENTLESPAEDISMEVEEEAEEHMFFFAFSDVLFADPEGDGNIDNRSDAVGYQDVDSNGQPLGLITSWTTGEAATGTLRIVLKHQPDIKTATSTAADGETDMDITFDVTVQ